MRGDQTTTRASVLDSAYDYLIVAIVSVVVVIGGGVWAIGQLAGLLFRGAWPPVSFTQALAAVFALRPAARKLPLSVKFAVGFFLLCVAGEQMVLHRRYAKEITWSRDMTGSIEYRVAQWVDRNLPGERVGTRGGWIKSSAGAQCSHWLLLRRCCGPAG